MTIEVFIFLALLLNALLIFTLLGRINSSIVSLQRSVHGLESTVSHYASSIDTKVEDIKQIVDQFSADQDPR